jgi:small-conductance mechanosensitive channel
MNRLVDLIESNTPLFPAVARLVVIVALFALAWFVSRLAGRLAAFLVDRHDRRAIDDTGVMSSLKQRETSISLIRTTVGYVAFGLAFVLAIGVLLGAHRVETVVGASFVAVVLAFAAQRFLTDVVAGLLMVYERWFRVGDTVVIEPWDIQGVLEEVSLRSLKIRGLNGEVMRVHNSEVKATLVVPRGFRQYELELYASDLDAASALVEEVGRIVPGGTTHFARRPTIEESQELDDDLFRLRARLAVAAGREWLAEEFLPSLMRERAPEGLVAHGPVVTSVDEQAARRFARAARTRGAPASSRS